MFKIIGRTDTFIIMTLLLGSVYVPFLLSEMIQLSGIITILFTGITARKFTNKNLTHVIRKHASFTFQLLAYLAETTCFLFLGFSAVIQDSKYFLPTTIFSALLLCLIGRAFNVYPLLNLVILHFICIMMVFNF